MISLCLLLCIHSQTFGIRVPMDERVRDLKVVSEGGSWMAKKMESIS